MKVTRCNKNELNRLVKCYSSISPNYDGFQEHEISLHFLHCLLVTRWKITVTSRKNWTHSGRNPPAWYGGLTLFGQVVHGADEVEDLHHVHPPDAEPAPASRHVVRFAINPISVKSPRENLWHQHSEDFWQYWDCQTRFLAIMGLPSWQYLNENVCLFKDDLWCTAHEVVEEVVGELDQVHDGFGTLQDLPVQGSLDVRLKILQTWGSMKGWGGRQYLHFSLAHICIC